ncbi:MAG: NUDIX hydrolase [Pseudonocardiaceae bacterium]
MRVAWVAVTTALLGAALAAVGAMRTATRLDRLHARTDAAWAALEAALYRRALTVSALEDSVAVRCAAHEALHAQPTAREELENELSRMLSALDRCGLEPASASELADAEQRVVIARRVYNDAVRDTLALRSHRLVRWLRLAGTAPLPRYFEIAEPTLAGYGLELDGAGA